MEHILNNAGEILNSHISGYHQYVLKKPVHLEFVSQNLCDMIGYTQKELLSKRADLYAPLVHPVDKEKYADFLRRLSQKEQTLTLEYQIVTKDGTIKYLSDTATSKRLKNGTLVAYSVLTDITSIKAENSNLHFLNETIPCGFLKYTCEKQPKITYVNPKMLEMLRFDAVADAEIDYLELYKSNIFLMIPMEERQKYAHFLRQVYTKGAPIAGELTVVRCDGTRARVYGWVTKCVNEQGQEEFQSVCMDITERYQAQKALETERYLNALKEVYDKIFEFDFANRTVKFLFGKKSDMFKCIENIPMSLREATEQWVQNNVVPEDCGRVLEFFQSFYQRKEVAQDGQPLQIEYRALSSKGEVKNYAGIFIKMESSVYLYCCRKVAEEQRVAVDTEKPVALSVGRTGEWVMGSANGTNEGISIVEHAANLGSEKVQNFTTHFSEGVVAFEVQGNVVTPLYSSDNVCEFFGYTKEEWMQMTQKRHSIRQFVSQSEVGYAEFQKLLENGEAEFTYMDLKTNKLRRIKAICSQKTPDSNSPRYIMLYNVEDKPNGNIENKVLNKVFDKDLNKAKSKTGMPVAENDSEVYIRTFGYFDVFINGKPVAFRNEKSKELLALLVDRRGGYITSGEAISFLWEDETVNTLTLARYRKVALRLKNILEEYGIADIVESVDGKRRIATDKVRCDLYDYLSQKEEYAQLFKGSYLSNYSWGETTLGELQGEHIL